MGLFSKEERVISSRYAIVVLAATALLSACKQTRETGTPPATDSSTTSATATSSTQPAAGAFPSIPAPVISSVIPTTVPSNATPEQLRPYFDWFSWESFIALNWPASSAGRGNPQTPDTPSTFAAMTNSTPVTWGTYKANWELYDQYDKRPTVWNDYSAPYAPSVCPQAAEGDKQLLMVTKGDTELQDIGEAFSFPLVDQQRNFVFYEVRYNQAYYDFVRGADNTPASWLYLSQNLPTDYTQVSLPPNQSSAGDAIMLKAAWRNLSNMQSTMRNRYYQVNAWVYNSQTNSCSQQLMGLVGFHIGQKTKEFPQWIWSTFEQVDNVPPKVDNVPSSFNNGTDNPPTGTQGFANRPTYTAPGQLPPTSPPTQVARLNPIPTTPAGASTVDVNAAFHNALPQSSPWRYYQLIVTQWPTNPTTYKPPANRGVYPEGAGSPFPVNGAVNVTMETYFQSAQLTTGSFGNSCMSCHYNAGGGLRDFSWGFARRPHQNAPPPSTAKLKATAVAAK
jgi:hypothetical protein